MTAQILIPDRAASVSLSTDSIDHLMAQSILDRLGMSLQDLSLDYGDVAIENGEISHILHYASTYSTYNTMGYIRQENSLFYTDGNTNHRTPQQAALQLLSPTVVEDCRYTIEIERAMAIEYF